MKNHIEITIERDGIAPVLNIKGDITATTGGAILEMYNGDDVINAERIMFQFDKSCYINSGGIAFLIEIATNGRKKNQKICASGLSDHYRMIFHMLGLSRCMEISPGHP